MGYVFLIPGFVFLGCFLVFPFFKSLVRSFTDCNAFSPDFSFVGLKNYIELFHNDEYWAAIKVNLVFAVVSTLIQTTLGFLLAFAVYYMTPKWQQFYKVALYIPVVLPASVVAVMWKFMLNKDIGLVNTLLRLVGLDNLTHAWIGEKSTALGTVIAVNTWQYIGFTMVLFYIAMMNISKDVLESAAVDGATKKDLFFNFFLHPLMSFLRRSFCIICCFLSTLSFRTCFTITFFRCRTYIIKRISEGVKIMKEKKKLTIGGIFSQIVLLILAVIVLYPLAFMFLTSIKSNLDVLTNPFGITTFKPENYVSAWKIGKIGSFFMNSVIITIMTLAVQLIVIILASFALGKLRPWGSGFIEILFLSGLFITSEMLTIPKFTTLKAWGLNGTRLALLLPYVTLGLPTATFIMINYVKGLPKELDEAALLDGCSLLQNLFRITLPLLKPVIATVMIFNFQGTWSEFYWALIEIKKDSLKTLPLGLMNFNSMYNTDYGVLCAGLCIATIPVVLLYLKCSSYFIGGMVAGAVKG